MRSDEPIIQHYLQDLVLELERKLGNPKNTWKRQEELKAQIADAEKRLQFITRKRQSRERSAREASGSERSRRPRTQASVISYR